jgi:hypothetical protein
MGFSSLILSRLRIRWAFQLQYYNNSIYPQKCIKLATQNCLFVQDRYNKHTNIFHHALKYSI